MSKRSQASRDPNAEVDLANPHATYNIQQVFFFSRDVAKMACAFDTYFGNLLLVKKACQHGKSA
jgi:hypothetical protein